MEVYLLDSLNRRTQVFDRYESLIWTERFSGWGDFEWKLHSTLENRSRLLTGLRIVINQSYRVMVIETIEDKLDEEGHEVLIVRGRSIEAILENRMARGGMSDLTTDPKWSFEWLPAEIARQMFHDICVVGLVNSGDIIAGITEARMPLLPADTIPEPTVTFTYEIDPITLYQAIKDLCDYYSMGFRMVRHPDTSALYWDVYMGSDRTTQQTTFDAVVFSTGLDNLSNTTELTSIALYKNVAYVLSPVGSETVYPDDVPSTISGFERNALIVIANDITDTTPSVATERMIQRGKEELAKNRRFAAFDGEITQNSRYEYGVDYNLGDLVEFQNDEGVSSVMQVTEQIFVSDREGERTYPTLVINEFVTPGAWNTWVPDQVWNAVSSTLVWDDAD